MKQNWVDTFKAIGCLAVILLHSLIPLNWNINSNIYDWTWVIGMLMDAIGRTFVIGFILVSGYLYKINGEKNSKKTGIRHLKTALIASIAYLAWKASRPEAYTTIADAIEKTTIITAPFELLTGTSFYHLWFLIVLGLIFIFIKPIKYIFSNINQTKIVIIYLVIFSIEVFLSINNIELIGLEALIHMPTTAFVFYSPIFIFGMKLDEFKNSDFFKIYRNKYIVLMLPLLIFLLLMPMIAEYGILNMVEIKSIIMLFLSYYNPLLVLSGIYLVLFISCTKKKYKLFDLISRHSFVVYIFHPFLLDVLKILA